MIGASLRLYVRHSTEGFGMRVGVLAVQGAFAEMEAYWRRKGAEVFEIRQCADLGRGMELLALPGGESTVQGKLLKDLGLFAPLRDRRNAYGRQLGSFRTVGTFDGKPNVPMTFIRAPAIVAAAPEVEVLSAYGGAPTAVRWRNVTAFTWHPELEPA